MGQTLLLRGQNRFIDAMHGAEEIVARAIGRQRNGTWPVPRAAQIMFPTRSGGVAGRGNVSPGGWRHEVEPTRRDGNANPGFVSELEIVLMKSLIERSI